MLNKLLTWFLSTKLWVSLARHLVAYFTFRVFGYPKFPMQKYFEILDLMSKDPESLYAFVSADKDSLAWKLTNFLTKAQWGHAGFAEIENGHVIIWHMKAKGLQKWHLLDLLRECDNFAIIKLGVSNINEAKNRLN